MRPFEPGTCFQRFSLFFPFSELFLPSSLGVHTEWSQALHRLQQQPCRCCPRLSLQLAYVRSERLLRQRREEIRGKLSDDSLTQMPVGDSGSQALPGRLLDQTTCNLCFFFAP